MYCCGMLATVTPSHTDSLARLGHALSDPTRARILLALREAPALPSELADGLGVSRQKLSNHLACLRGCGLVDGAKEGRNTRYRLSDPHLDAALGDLMRLTLIVDPDCCSAGACRCA
ncbi:transcriptional regulator [Brachybacterium ginsengisoli]|uniref:Transcriptional regulator n=2 Tax=Brachybacterium ginsengisoli TaxID=1331682 RepID=A0A291GSV4_9MICO|nr:transcriptional regulator [Brachybacterium ginsengisoli]